MTVPLLAAATLTSGLFIGLIPTLVDGLRPLWQARLNETPRRLEQALGLFYFSWVVMPLVGFLLDAWPRFANEILFAGMIGLIATLTWLGMVRSFAALVGSLVLLGVAYSIITTTAVLLMTQVLFPEEEDYKVAALNIGFLAVALGAMLGPALVRLIERWWGYRQGLLYLSFACVVPAALAAISDRPPARPVVEAWQSILVEPALLMLVGILLLYFAMENCLDFWPEAYLRELGHEGRGLRMSLNMFWLAFLVTRGAAAWWLFEHPTHAIALTLALVFFSAMLVGNLVSGDQIGIGSFGCWLAAACYGPLLPSLLGIAFLVLPKLPASGLGLLLALSGLDTLAVRPLMRYFAANRPARVMMRVPAVLAVMLAIPLVALAFLWK